MSKQTPGSKGTPARAKASGASIPFEEAVLPLTPEGAPKPPLPESLEVLEAAEPNVIKDGAVETEPPKAQARPDAGDEIGFDAFSAQQQAQLEKLSANLARAALAAQGAIAEVALKQADRPAALSPDPFNVAPALTDVLGRLASHPDRLMSAHAELFNRYMDLWHATTRVSYRPEACLINYYGPTARLGLHRDQDEDAKEAPILSISLGDTALFRLGGPDRKSPTRSVKLSSGDAVLLDGPSRHWYHGVDRILPGTSQLLPEGGRFNLTLRRVTRP